MNISISNMAINNFVDYKNNIVMALSELNCDIKKILLDIMTAFMPPALQVAYA